MCVVGLLLTCGFLAWTYQIFIGMGAAGKRTPQMWAMYITTFVFWIGIGHAGTLISAVLYLFRARWRTSIYRARGGDDDLRGADGGPLPADPRRAHVVRVLPAAVPEPALPVAELQVAAGVGRVRDLHVPDRSARCSSSSAWCPDIAALRDASTGWRRRIYAMLVARAGRARTAQWRHYRRAYGLFAALATPLVLSVHSVVSWDFAMALVPGWHSTLFAPFFVDGAIFSGFAMVLILILPMRYFFNLYAYITDRHLDAMAKLILVTGLVLTYFYVCEVFTSWYSGDHFEKASLFWRSTRTYAWALWHDVLLQLRAPR